jgi:hypothetical protein
VWHIAEEMATWSELSDQVHYLPHSPITLELPPLDSDDLLIHRVEGFTDSHFRRLVEARDTQDKILGNPTFDLDIDAHSSFIDGAFWEEFGCTYKDALYNFMQMIEIVPSRSTGSDVAVYPKADILKRFAKGLGVSRERSERILSGFTIDKARLEPERRQIWKPKQEYRLYRRGVIQVYDGHRPILMWSRQMASEAIMRLATGLCSQQISAEWKSPGINAALGTISKFYGDWFETKVSENATSRDTYGAAGRMEFGMGSSKVKVPPEIGEIDYFGYSTRLKAFLVLECKLTGAGTQSKLFWDEMTDFINGENAYVKRFRLKVNWVRDNIGILRQALESEPSLRGHAPFEGSQLLFTIVTRYPIYIKKGRCGMPIITLAELCKLLEGSEQWPSGGE